jgi:two-component system, NtrC family, sensor kinase
MHLLRLVLLLDVLAAALAGAAVLVGVGAPLAAAGKLGPGQVVLAAAAAAVAVVAVGFVLLMRSVARPVDRLLATAEQLGAEDGALPLLSATGERDATSLSRAAIAFERVATALREERGRLAAKVAELERTNRELAEARASWIRSERLAALGRLASGIAHEVGNPLGAIAGFTEVARGRLGPGSGEVEDLLRRIAAESARIDRLVRDMLDFARPADPVCLPIAIRPVVESALRLARVQPRFKDVDPVLDLPGDLPPVLADEGRLAQVLLNLLLNAGDAMGGRGRVRVEAIRDGGGVQMRVADEGPGIPPEHLARIFDPFFTTKAPGTGTGLGLSVSHRLMEAMGGRIDARNAPPGGAVFELWLPAEGGGARRGGGEPASGAC